MSQLVQRAFAGCRLVAPVLCLVPWLAAQEVQTNQLPPGLRRFKGQDTPSGISYVRFLLDGKLVSVSGASGELPEGTTPPELTAQCTRDASGKLGFELLANFGGVSDLAYYPPWNQARDGGLFAPRLEKAVVTMEFLGYTHVKPVKRQWEELLQPPGQLRYNRPSAGTSNMEDLPYYLRYLAALPTLRLTYRGLTIEFKTASWLDQIRNESQCRAAGL